jgi:two-component system chemotaxis response regulator CheY
VQLGHIGLIISDWNMPNCTGLELLKKVRADQNLSKTPFLLVTAEAEQGQVSEAIKSGVDQYVVKPFSKEGLKAKLELTHKKILARKSA